MMRRYAPYLMLGGAFVLAVVAWIPLLTNERRGPRTFAADRGPGSAQPMAVQSPVKPGALTNLVRVMIRDLGASPTGDSEQHVLRLMAVLEQEQRGTATSRRRAAETVVAEMQKRVVASRRLGWSGKDFDPQALDALAGEIAGHLRQLPAAGGQHDGHEGTLLRAVEARPSPGHAVVNFHTLGGFEYEVGQPLPQKVLALNAQPVAIAGYMVSLGETNAVTEFLLVESLWNCCFGVPPEIHQGVVVTVPDGGSVPFTTEPIQVQGALQVGESFEDGEVISIYRLYTADVQRLK